MTWTHLTPLVEPSPWNSVSITTAIGSGVAILVSLGVLLLTWVKIPKPYWKGQVQFYRGDASMKSVMVKFTNVGGADARDVLIGDPKFMMYGWERKDVLSPGQSLQVSAMVVDAGGEYIEGQGWRWRVIQPTKPVTAKFRVTWRQTPFPSIKRKKIFKVHPTKT